MKRSRWVWALVATCLVAPASRASEPPNPAPLVATRRAEIQAVASGSRLAVVRDEGRAGWQLYLHRSGAPAYHVNRPGTTAVAGGIAGNRVVYAEHVKRRSTIRFMDLDSKRRWNAPRAVNAAGTHEFLPVMSEEWLVFARFKARPASLRVVAYNFETKRTRVLYRSEEDYEWTPRTYVQPGQVSGRFFVMVVRHPGYRSGLFVYDLKKGHAGAIYAPRGSLWAPSIREDGVVYTVATGMSCGSNARLLRYRLDRRYLPYLTYTDFTPLARLGEGFDSWNSHAYVDAAGDTKVIYQRSHCDRHPRSSDIWSYRDMVPLLVAKAGLGFGTVVSDSGSIACGDRCTASLPGGSGVTLTAYASPGSHFTGWSEPCGTEPTCVISLDRASDVTATFEPGV